MLHAPRESGIYVPEACSLDKHSTHPCQTSGSEQSQRLTMLGVILCKMCTQMSSGVHQASEAHLNVGDRCAGGLRGGRC